MKRSLIIFPTLLCGMYVLLGSNAAGPASAGNGIRNGAPGSIGTCTSCHGSGTGTTTASLDLKEKVSGTAASGMYKPGVVYTVTISGNNPDLAFFGFQVSAVKGTAQAGTFSNMGADKHIANISGLQLVEHSTSLAKTNNLYSASFDWTAPVAGTGTVTFNGIINAVNKDGGTGGDRVSSPVTLTLTEAVPSSVGELNSRINLQLSPVPVADVLHISGEGITSGNYELRIYDLNGKVVWQGQQPAKNNLLQAAVPVNNLAAGTYVLHLKGKDRVVKLFSKK